MMYSRLRITLFALLPLLLSACFGPQSPEAVVAAFWQEVIDDDATGAVRLSTLSDARQYDGFGSQWHGYEVSLGRVVIDRDEASVETRFHPVDRGSGPDRSHVSYLIRDDDRWLLDYERTAAGINGGVFGDLLVQLNRFGREFARNFDQSATTTSSHVEVLLEQLEARQAKLSRHADDALDDYRDALNGALKEMQRSVEGALKEHAKQLSNADKAVLQTTADNLEDSREHLQSDSLLSVAHSSHTLTAAQQSLARIKDDELEHYQAQWHALVERFRREMQELLQALADN